MRKTRLALAMAMLPLSSSPLWAGETQLPEVQVKDRLEQASPLKSSLADTASLLEETPGVSAYTAGGVSSLPVIHGMADDRLRIKVDGMDLIASCPNHMNSPLSYIDPSNVGNIQVYSGIAPVSLGGDSIGGTIIVNSPAPVFAAPGQGTLTQGEAGAFYRSNGNARGAHLNATYATESLSLSYAGSTAEAANYKAAENFKTTTATGRAGHTTALDEVGSTAYKTNNHALTLALKADRHLLEAKIGYQDIPYELYPNQRMDMLGNTQHSFNLRYRGEMDWGTLEANAYREKVNHYMDFGADKQYAYGILNNATNYMMTGIPTTAPGNSYSVFGMPMYTEGKTTGLSVKGDIPLSSQDLLRVGLDIQQYRLNDWWPPAPDCGVGNCLGGMAPLTFLNINDGKRDRTGLFAELETQWNKEWMSLIGLRAEHVVMDTGTVTGYNNSTTPAPVSGLPIGASTGYGTSSVGTLADFNNMKRQRTDNNIDFTLLARHTPDETRSFEYGLAQKTRSPNLYERYTWSRNAMALIMNNFVGDGNGYMGDPNLKPEVAYTLSFTGDWHSSDRATEFKITPYYTYVKDYIDAVQWNRATNLPASPAATNSFVTLKYANQAARLYGFDASARARIASSPMFGDLGFQGLLAYTDGMNMDTGDELYNIMPLNTKLALTQQTGGWNNRVELVGVAGKKSVSDARNEIRTSGYGLVHLRGSYSWQKVRLDFGVENLFDRYYQLPQGGAYSGQGMTMSINGIPWGIAVPGPARSLYTALTVKF